MKLAFKIIWVLTITLSLATGIFKILMQPADIVLFERIGMTAQMTFVLGIIQVIGGLLLIPSKTRKVGAYLMVGTFVLAAIAVFANGMFGFGIVSIGFILLPLCVLYEKRLKN